METTIRNLLELCGLEVSTADEKSFKALTLMLLLWHFRGGELYMLVYDGDKEVPAYKVPILQYDSLYADKEGRTYSLLFEAGDGFQRAAEAVEACGMYKSLIGHDV